MNTIEKRIRVFEDVRDVEYHIALDGEPDWSCATKSFLLQRRLASLGIGSIFAYGTYSWRELQLPAELLEVLPSDEAWHQWLRVFVPETQMWVDVDASWDVGLEKLFPRSCWDGLNSTRLAVPIVRRCSEEENAAISGNGYQPELVGSYMLTHRPFLAAFNDYLVKTRQRRNM